jgi:hypothetical protein
MIFRLFKKRRGIKSKFKTLPLTIQGLLSGFTFWTIIVAIAWCIYPIKQEGFEAAGLTLLILGLPSSLLLNLFDNPSVLKQVILLSLFGYLQWPLLGILFVKNKL